MAVKNEGIDINLTHETLSKRNKEDRAALIDWTVFHLLFMFSVLTNFIYATYLQELIFYCATMFIRIADKSGFYDMHLVRFVY